MEAKLSRGLLTSVRLALKFYMGESPSRLGYSNSIKGFCEMSYDVFKERVRGLTNRSGSKVIFSHEDGKHIARCSDGVTIIGNVLCPRVLVKWGSGHSAYATI